MTQEVKNSKQIPVFIFFNEQYLL